MAYKIPITPAEIRSEIAAATRRGMGQLEYRERRLAGFYFCSNCNQWRAESDFRRDSSKAPGIGGPCRICTPGRRKRDPEYQNKQKQREYMQRQERATEQYQQPKSVNNKQAVLPYAFRQFSNQGTLSEALRIDIGDTNN